MAGWVIINSLRLLVGGLTDIDANLLDPPNPPCSNQEAKAWRARHASQPWMVLWITQKSNENANEENQPFNML